MTRYSVDGQLASSSSTLLGADGYTRVASIWLFNTSGTVSQIVRLTLTRPNSSARIIARIELEPYANAYMGGVGLDPSDVLAGYTDDATTVDYVIRQTNSRDDESMSARPLSDKFDMQLRDKTGRTLAGEDDLLAA